MAEEKKSYKWISKAIESLDAEKDYAEIFRLSMSYGGNDFMNTLIYCLVFPNFIVTEWGARVIWRRDGGKVLRKAANRVEQTENKNAAWWWYGPHDPRTKQSVESINNLHAYWAKHYEGDFSHNEDYIYTLAFTAIVMHRLRLMLGLPDVSEKIKTASYLVMRDMVPLFRAEGEKPIHSFPSDWYGLLKFCEDFENQPHPGSEQGNLCANAMYDFFAFRYFPKPLRWLGRAIPIALSLPTTLKAHRVKPVNPVLRAVIVWVFGWLFWLQDNVLPDPQVAFLPQLQSLSPEEQSRRTTEIRKLDREYPAYFAKQHSNLGQWGGCPFHEALGMINDGGVPDKDYKDE
ncbi:hypothetical protein FOVG_16433 [Fusarium oxysporum f. sp. pisi HDV247]|uniref:ER-bound oxygenase mpaB/mpaB'/Rubber oxygenase catalytic domain-containing protein n=1 Tax=Fusarium oxysporum f. sp. pisi HDV247 TaxID=1080344 RepID=W9NR07_FUSOX|nr:hypothetical protein FOVG_16433 [Fusarium oxysporum f. sp. pisi HDV247]